MNLSNITVIIRSVNENTEETCYRLLLDAGFSKKQIIIVHEYPFTKTLKKCFQLGIENNRDWLLCIDADVLPNPKTILSLCNSANDQPPNVAVVLAYVADRVFGSIRVAGNHLYRTCYLNKAINLIPKDSIVLTSNPWQFSYHTGFRSVMFPFTENLKSVEKIAKKYNAAFIAVIDNDARSKLLQQKLNYKENKTFDLFYDSENLQIYEVFLNKD